MKGPICKPEMVITNRVLTVAPVVVIIKLAVVVAPQVNSKFATLVAPTVGITDDTKKFGGYIKVIVPPGGICGNGVNAKVADVV